MGGMGHSGGWASGRSHDPPPPWISAPLPSPPCTGKSTRHIISVLPWLRRYLWCHRSVYWINAVYLIMYVLCFSVMLLNMLIAMMNSTYSHHVVIAERRWLVERANIMADYESEMSPEEMVDERLRYSVPEQRNAGLPSHNAAYCPLWEHKMLTACNQQFERYALHSAIMTMRTSQWSVKSMSPVHSTYQSVYITVHNASQNHGTTTFPT